MAQKLENFIVNKKYTKKYMQNLLCTRNLTRSLNGNIGSEPVSNQWLIPLGAVTDLIALFVENFTIEKLW
jgi:hypothetical protein